MADRTLRDLFSCRLRCWTVYLNLVGDRKSEHAVSCRASMLARCSRLFHAGFLHDLCASRHVFLPPMPESLHDSEHSFDDHQHGPGHDQSFLPGPELPVSHCDDLHSDKHWTKKEQLMMNG